MSTVEWDSAQLALFRAYYKQIAQRDNDTARGAGWAWEASRLAHMSDRQLWTALRLHSFLGWIEYEGREHIRRDRMRPVPSVADDDDAVA